jgi:LPPG:FO 2-phospho-L-lactate transferase
MIAVLTGGTGGAKFVQGLSRVLPGEELAVIVNTGDDLVWWGLHVSPDLDSITYALAGILSRERGWGVDGDTFRCRDAMARLGEPEWFQLGDLDLATHLVRTRLLNEGRSLTEATRHIVRGFDVRSTVLPMSDSGVETRVQTNLGDLSFQEYFVRERFRPAVETVRFVGAENAPPAPGVLDAISSAEAVLIAPSNPVTSIGPILAVPGISEALARTSAPVVGVSPIVGSAAVSGPAGALMRAQGLPVSVAGVARAYHRFLDVLLVDLEDAAGAEREAESGVRFQAANILMRTGEDKISLAREALAAARSATRANRSASA